MKNEDFIKYINKKIRLGLVIIIIGLVLSIANTYIKNNIILLLTILLPVIGIIMITAALFEKINKLEEDNILKDYEINLLRYSYTGMGKYIKDMNIPELDDIEKRINNELLDIEVKKEWFNAPLQRKRGSK